MKCHYLNPCIAPILPVSVEMMPHVHTTAESLLLLAVTILSQCAIWLERSLLRFRPCHACPTSSALTNYEAVSYGLSIATSNKYTAYWSNGPWIRIQTEPLSKFNRRNIERSVQSPHDYTDQIVVAYKSHRRLGGLEHSLLPFFPTLPRSD